MILYFSATNNCKAVAMQIAKETGDDIVSISSCMEKNQTQVVLKEEEQLGIIFPTYFLGLPFLVEDFLKSLQIQSKHTPFTYLIATYGNSSGHALRDAKNLLQHHQIQIHATYGIRMVDTWTPIFDLRNSRKNEEKTKRAMQAATVIAKEVKTNTLHQKHEWIPSYITNQVHKSLKQKSKTSHFHVEKQCSGCGLCVQNCPVKAISLQEGKPVWIKDSCQACLRCLHHCPCFAIQYDNKTKQHGQFVHPLIKP